MLRNKIKNIIKNIAVTTTLVAGTIVPIATTAPVAQANVQQQRILGYAFDDIGYGGRHGAIVWNDLGPCDYHGYQMELFALPGGWVYDASSWMKHSAVNEQCNYIVLWSEGTFQSRYICHQGYLSMRWVYGCNGRTVRADFVHR